MNQEFKMKRGESVKYFADNFDTNAPEIAVISGPHPYLWVGGDNGFCYATLEGESLIKLRNAITGALRRRSINDEQA
jgi:hypothetical protein